MSTHTDKIKEKILEDPDTLIADSNGHKWGTMQRGKIKRKVCIRCGVVKHNIRANQPCLVAI